MSPQHRPLHLDDVKIRDTSAPPAVIQSPPASSGGGGGGGALRGSRSHVVTRIKRSGYHGSADSLLVGNTAVRDADGCFRSQCNQVFIGMISMQYQPRNVSTSRAT